jgi:beta-N-acetylhexosaminidase
VLDLYCGLGNVTLPMARRAAAVTGVEGEPALIERARANARANGISNADFAVCDLSQPPDPALPWMRGRYDAVLLDPPRRIGHEYDLDRKSGVTLARSMGWLMAAELRAHGVDLSFAPCVDLDYGVSEVIGDRAFHAKPEAVAELALAWVRGMHDAGMAATAKHFPGHGAVVADSHQSLPVDRRDWSELAADVLPYRRLIANGLPGVMVAHVLFPAVAPEPASLSRRWIQNALREELRFEGAIFTDDLSMGGAKEFGDIVARASAALAAGCDVLPVCNDRASVVTLLDQLDHEIQPSSHLRLVRMRGKAAPERGALLAGEPWRASQELLARSQAAPALRLTAGNA